MLSRRLQLIPFEIIMFTKQTNSLVFALIVECCMLCRPYEWFNGFHVVFAYLRHAGLWLNPRPGSGG